MNLKELFSPLPARTEVLSPFASVIWTLMTEISGPLFSPCGQKSMDIYLNKLCQELQYLWCDIWLILCYWRLWDLLFQITIPSLGTTNHMSDHRPLAILAEACVLMGHAYTRVHICEKTRSQKSCLGCTLLFSHLTGTALSLHYKRKDIHWAILIFNSKSPPLS